MTEILVNVSPREVRAALVENGVLQEIFLERANRRGLISNIYKGRVSRVLPGMQAAFIDIGMERTAFLHASDIFDPRHADTGIEPPHTENIRSLVAEGNEILVQVVKDPLGTKGARLTTYITLPSRYLVYMPKGRGVGVSARIEVRKARSDILVSCCGPGWIVCRVRWRSRKLSEPVPRSRPPSSPRTRSVEPVKPSSAGEIQLCTKEARKPSIRRGSESLLSPRPLLPMPRGPRCRSRWLSRAIP